MNKSILNYWVDVGLIMSFFVCFISGLIKWPGLIKIIGVSAYKVLHANNISMLHDWSGLIMGLLILIHLSLHWNWVAVMAKRIFSLK